MTNPHINNNQEPADSLPNIIIKYLDKLRDTFIYDIETKPEGKYIFSKLKQEI
jgi:hypothetical protein